MRGASFEGPLDAIALQVGGSLDMSSKDQDKAGFKDVNLNSAKIGGNVQMFGTSFDGVLDATALQVGGYLSMRNDKEQSIDLTNQSRWPLSLAL